MSKQKGFANTLQDLTQTIGRLWPGREKAMKKIAKHLMPNLGTLVILGLFLLAQTVGARPSGSPLGQGPSATMISYQGRLTDADGVPLSGDYQMRFALYDVPTEGTWCWEETQTVTVSDGLFNVLLGSTNAIDHSCLTGDVYLGIKIGDDSEMTPRELLTSVPFAVQAQDVTGLIKGQYGGGKTGGGSSFTEQYHVGSLPYDSGGAYQKLFVTVWGGGWINTTLGMDFYSIASRGGLKVTRTRLFGTTNHYSLKIYDNGSSYDVVVEIEPNWPSVVIRSQKMDSPDTISEQDVTPGYDPTGKTDVTPTIENHIITDKSGNVGIGTASPDKKLHIVDTVKIGGTTDGDGDLVLHDTDDTRTVHISAGSGTDSFFNTGGNVGIGTTNPQIDLAIGDGDTGLQQQGDGKLAIYTNNHERVRIQGTKVGIGTTSPTERLHVNGNIRAGGDLSVEGKLNMNGHDIQSIGTIHPGGDTVNVGGNLNVTKDGTSKIEGNLQIGDNSWDPSFAGMDGNDMAVDGQFEQAGSGGARLYKVGVGRDPDNDEGTLAVSKHIKVDGSDGVTAPRFNSAGGSDLSVDAGYGSHNTLNLLDDVRIPEGNLDMVGHDVNNVNTIYVQDAHCGALLEANLQTPEEQELGENDRFEEGDVLCWAEDRLEKCTAANDRLVQAVANAKGEPIVIGAEAVKVLGPLQKGDLLVASDVPGFATVNNDPAPGTVIAQALEGFEGEKGIVKAMIRKF